MGGTCNWTLPKSHTKSLSECPPLSGGDMKSCMLIVIQQELINCEQERDCPRRDRMGGGAVFMIIEIRVTTSIRYKE